MPEGTVQGRKKAVVDEDCHGLIESPRDLTDCTLQDSVILVRSLFIITEKMWRLEGTSYN